MGLPRIEIVVGKVKPHAVRCNVRNARPLLRRPTETRVVFNHRTLLPTARDCPAMTRFGEPPVGSFVARQLIETRLLTVASPAYIKTHRQPRHPKDVKTRTYRFRVALPSTN